MPRSAPAVVVHDVPEGITVAGNPARVISRKQRGRYVRKVSVEMRVLEKQPFEKRGFEDLDFRGAGFRESRTRNGFPGNKNTKASEFLHWPLCFCSGAPGEIRTPDHQVRSLVLYPAELRALSRKIMTARCRFVKPFRNFRRRCCHRATRRKAAVKLAETEGFEPSMELLTPYSLSRGAPSASRASLRDLQLSAAAKHNGSAPARQTVLSAAVYQPEFFPESSAGSSPRWMR